MAQKAKSVVSVWSLIKDSFHYYRQSFAASFIFILIAAALHVGGHVLLTGMLTKTVSWILCAIVALLSIYFWTAALVAINQRLATNTSVMKESLRLGLKKYPYILGFLALYILTYIVLTLWLRLLIYVGAHIPALAEYQGIINLFLAGLPLLLLLLLFLLALPLLIIEEMNVWRAYKLSVKLAWRSRLGAVFMLFIWIMLLFYFIAPRSRHGVWLQHHHFAAPFHFLILLVLVPLIMNYMLLLARRLRHVTA